MEISGCSGMVDFGPRKQRRANSVGVSHCSDEWGRADAGGVFLSARRTAGAYHLGVPLWQAGACARHGPMFEPRRQRIVNDCDVSMPRGVLTLMV
jgi:hypothetical protein